MALAAIGLFSHTGVIDAYWWLIVAGLYGAGALGWPRSGTRPACRAHRAFELEMLAQQVRKLVDSVAKGLPPEAVELLHSIEATMRELLPRLEEMRDRGVISQKDSFTVIETVRRYLPDTLAAYLRLPKFYAQVQTLADGKTASRIAARSIACAGHVAKGGRGERLQRRRGEVHRQRAFP